VSPTPRSPTRWSPTREGAVTAHRRVAERTNATAARAHVTVDGLALHAERWTPSGAVEPGVPTILLVHGLGASTVTWHAAGPALAEATGHRVLAVDLPGFGQSRALGRTGAFEANATLLSRLLDDLGPSVVVGNSMGACLGVRLAAHVPDLVTRLVLVNAAYPYESGTSRLGPIGDRLNRALFAGFMGPALIPRYGAAIIGARARRRGPERIVDAGIRNTFADPARVDPSIREALVEGTRDRLTWPEAPAAYADAARSLYWHLTRPDGAGMLADLAGVRCPTLVLHGRRDRLVRHSWARAHTEHRPGWTFALHDHGAHVPQLEHPEWFLDTVTGWLARPDGVT
jgi:pimeloyl-ACP methyl ester carboxylesterase